MSSQSPTRLGEDEVVSFASDHRSEIGGLPREFKRRMSGAPPKAPALWTSPDVYNLDATGLNSEGVWGALPKGFISWVAPLLDCKVAEILHVCSGGLPKGAGRVRVDRRREVEPDIVADGRRLPFRDNAFRAVLIDPPYTKEYARDLYNTDYPRPSHLLREAFRVVEPCGRVGIVHFLVPMPPKGSRLELVRGITTGCGYRIRALTVYTKDQDELPLGGSS